MEGGQNGEETVAKWRRFSVLLAERLQGRTGVHLCFRAWFLFACLPLPWPDRDSAEVGIDRCLICNETISNDIWTYTRDYSQAEMARFGAHLINPVRMARGFACESCTEMLNESDESDDDGDV